MTAGIYKISSILDDRYYLGSSSNIERRWVTHKSQLNNSNHVNIFLQRAWDKYGIDNFKLEIIIATDNLSREELFVLEQEYLNHLDDKCYNLSRFASGGDNISYHPNKEDIIQRIRQSVLKTMSEMSEEQRKILFSKPGEKNGMFGKTHTDDVKEFLSKNSTEYFIHNDSYRLGKTFEELFGDEESSRLKTILSESASHRVGDKNSFFGKSHTAEAKLIISESRKGKYFGSQNIPIIINNIRYESLGKASKDLNIPIATIRWRILSNNKKYKDYKYENIC